MSPATKNKQGDQESFQNIVIPSSIRKETKISMEKSNGPKPSYHSHKKRIGSFSIRPEEPDRSHYKMLKSIIYHYRLTFA